MSDQYDFIFDLTHNYEDINIVSRPGGKCSGLFQPIAYLSASHAHLGDKTFLHIAAMKDLPNAIEVSPSARFPFMLPVYSVFWDWGVIPAWSITTERRPTKDVNQLKRRRVSSIFELRIPANSTGAGRPFPIRPLYRLQGKDPHLGGDGQEGQTGPWKGQENQR